MSFVDAARAEKRTWEEYRKLATSACRELPCPSAFLLRPGCNICVHEGKIRSLRKEGKKYLEGKCDEQSWKGIYKGYI